MENLVAKVSYLKGLCDGLAIDESKPEGKLLVNVVDVLKDIAAALDDVDKGSTAAEAENADTNGFHGGILLDLYVVL